MGAVSPPSDPMAALEPVAPMSRIGALSRRYPHALIAVGVLLYAMGPLLAKASACSGPVFVFWRLWLGVVAFGIAALVHLRWTGRLPSRAGIGWAVRGGLAFGVHQLLFIMAIKATSVVDVVLVGTLAPIVVGIAAVPLFRERPSGSFRLWSLVAMGGAAVVAVAGSTGPNGDPVGMTLAVCNMLAFVTFYLFSKQSRDHIDVIPYLFGVMLVAALTVSAYALVADEAVTHISERDLWLTLAQAFGPGFAGHFVMTWPLKYLPANVPPVMRLAVPIVAGLGAYTFLDEQLYATHLIGGAFVLGGVLGAVRSRVEIESPTPSAPH